MEGKETKMSNVFRDVRLALIASLMPARRVAQIDPMQALRDE